MRPRERRNDQDPGVAHTTVMASAKRVYEVTRELLETEPELQAALEEVIAVDTEQTTWTFDDIPLDSGRFGTLVSEGVVERIDGEYRLADRDAMTAAINDKPLSAVEATGTTTGSDHQTTEDATTATGTLQGWFQTLTPGTVVGLIVGILAVAGVRSLIYPSVMRDDQVVSPANDPYYYRYVQRQLLNQDTLAPTAIADIGQAGVRPWAHAMHWWLAELTGGTQASADLIAAWLPILGSVGLGVVLFAIAMRLTDDSRVATLAVVFLAIAPVNVVYTSLGFLEHRLHQYFWLGVLVFGLVWLATDLHRRYHTDAPTAARSRLQDRNTIAIVALLTVTVGITPHIWGGSPLILLPVAIYIAFRAVIDGRVGLAPAQTLAPVIIAIAGGAILAYLPHTLWGWRRAFAVLIPVFIVGGAIGVAILATWWYQRELPAVGLVIGEGLIAGGSLLGFRLLAPDAFGRLASRTGDLFFREGILEVKSLYNLENFIILEPLYQIGIAFYFALPVLGWLTWRGYRRYEPAWLVMTVFGWYFVILAGLQARFGGQLTLFIAVFGAIGVIQALAKIDLVDRVSLVADKIGTAHALTLPVSGRKAVYISLIIIVITSANLIILPQFFADTAYSGEFNAAMSIDEHAQQTDREYPENFVLSKWGDNRMYNYFVNGEARGYGYARSNYEDFLSSTDPDSWYEKFDGQVGYVVTKNVQSPEESTHHKLHNRFGINDSSVSHYRMVYARPGIRAFAIVDGAEMQITGNDGTTVTVQTSINNAVTGLESADQIQYRQTGTLEDGQTTLRVAYPGEYQIQNSNEAVRTVTIDRAMIENGESINIDLTAS